MPGFIAGAVSFGVCFLETRFYMLFCLECQLANYLKVFNILSNFKKFKFLILGKAVYVNYKVRKTMVHFWFGYCVLIYRRQTFLTGIGDLCS